MSELTEAVRREHLSDLDLGSLESRSDCNVGLKKKLNSLQNTYVVEDSSHRVSGESKAFLVLAEVVAVALRQETLSSIHFFLKLDNNNYKEIL